MKKILIDILLQEYEDVQLTAYLSTLTKSTNILNDVRARQLASKAILRSFLQLVDKHTVLTAVGREDRAQGGGRRRGLGGMGRGGEWERGFH